MLVLLNSTRKWKQYQKSFGKKDLCCRFVVRYLDSESDLTVVLWKTIFAYAVEMCLPACTLAHFHSLWIHSVRPLLHFLPCVSAFDPFWFPSVSLSGPSDPTLKRTKLIQLGADVFQTQISRRKWKDKREVASAVGNTRNGAFRLPWESKRERSCTCDLMISLTKRAPSSPMEQVEGGGWKQPTAHQAHPGHQRDPGTKTACGQVGASTDADERSSERNNWTGGNVVGMRGGR